MSKPPPAETLDPFDWLVIARDVDLPRLQRDVERLRQAYPGRYDIRVDADDEGAAYEVAVRHRE